MMKEENMESGVCNGCKNCGAGCDCGRMHGYHGHPLLRILLALVIVVFVFIAGIKLGELKAELNMSYQHHYMMMGGQDGYGDMRRMGEGQPMMPVVVPVTATTSAATLTPAK